MSGAPSISRAPSVRDALAAARAAGVAGLDARAMLARVLGTTRSRLIADDSRILAAGDAAAWHDWLARRSAGEPLAYLLGEKEFHGHALRVGPAVLVPRPETEGLVDWALELLAERAGDRTPARVVDLGTGSGAVAIAVAIALGARSTVAPSPPVIVATDLGAAALDVARANAARLGADVTFVAGDWWQALAGERFDLAVANPPYVAAGDPALAALRHEPIGALASGAEGLDALRAIVAGAPGHLRPGGRLLLEHGASQGDAVRSFLRAAGFERIETRRDLAGHERLTGGRIAAARSSS